MILHSHHYTTPQSPQKYYNKSITTSKQRQFGLGALLQEQQMHSRLHVQGIHKHTWQPKNSRTYGVPWKEEEACPHPEAVHLEVGPLVGAQVVGFRLVAGPLAGAQDLWLAADLPHQEILEAWTEVAHHFQHPLLGHRRTFDEASLRGTVGFVQQATALQAERPNLSAHVWITVASLQQKESQSLLQS